MSFFDDEPSSRPSSRRAPPSAAGDGVDRRSIMVRRSIALVVGVLILLLLVFLVDGCLDQRRERALTGYTRDVGVLVGESNNESRQLFDLLREPQGQSPVDLQNSVNGIGVRADRLVDRARELDTPDELSESRDYLLETLEFRRDGIGAISRRLPAALGGEGRGAASRDIAAQMQNFLVSDVIYSQRFTPALDARLREEQLLGPVRTPPSRFLPDIDWLRPRVVAARVAGTAGPDAGDEAAAPGLHGTGLAAVSVSPSGQALTEGGAAEIPVSEDLAFEVQVQNQGSSTEQDVTVRVSIAGAGRPITVEEEIPTIDAGQTQTATIPLADAPPTARPVTIEVEIARVRGERMLENNRASYRAIFTE